MQAGGSLENPRTSGKLPRLAQEKHAMSEPTIRCPKCNTDIKLTEGLAAPLIAATREQYEKQLSTTNAEMARREAALLEQSAKLKRSEQTLGTQVADQVAEQLRKERAAITADSEKKARQSVALEVEAKTREAADLQAALTANNMKLIEAQKAQADAVRLKRELEDSRRELELTIEKRIQEGLQASEAKARRRVEDETRLKMAEKDKLIADAQRQVDEMKRKMEQGSQQLQGEVQELEIEGLLRAKFARDTIEPVGKGERGADAIHRIFGPAGQICGTILWESKRTRNWSDSWLPKLREDQRTAKAEIAVIVTQVLPKGIESFDLIDGVWVCSHRCAIPVAIALRQSLIELAAARQAGEGLETKRDMVYQYLTGPRFRHRVQAIVEAFSDMKDDLDKERKVISKQWAKREEQIERVMQGTVGFYGDLQGIAGKTLREIEGLDMKLLGDGDEQPED